MSLLLFTEQSTIHRAGEPEYDRYGDPIPGTGVEDIPLLCSFEPLDSAEEVELREQYSETYRAFFPLAVELNGWDGVTLHRLGSRKFDVIGEPLVTPPGFVLDGAIQVRLGRIAEGRTP